MNHYSTMEEIRRVFTGNNRCYTLLIEHSENKIRTSFCKYYMLHRHYILFTFLFYTGVENFF